MEGSVALTNFFLTISMEMWIFKSECLNVPEIKLIEITRQVIFCDIYTLLHFQNQVQYTNLQVLQGQFQRKMFWEALTYFFLTVITQ